jgi:hypothetical protein
MRGAAFAAEQAADGDVFGLARFGNGGRIGGHVVVVGVSRRNVAPQQLSDRDEARLLTRATTLSERDHDLSSSFG